MFYIGIKDTFPSIRLFLKIQKNNIKSIIDHNYINYINFQINYLSID